jgi:hypothetical protein
MDTDKTAISLRNPKLKVNSLLNQQINSLLYSGTVCKHWCVYGGKQGGLRKD